MRLAFIFECQVIAAAGLEPSAPIRLEPVTKAVGFGVGESVVGDFVVVGCLLGSLVGKNVGSFVVVGTSVGKALGVRLEGREDGFTVVVGNIVGCVGKFVGSPVVLGLAVVVGKNVGGIVVVGKKEGLFVANGLGCLVG